jgi:uncharacterized protein (TIGR02246 family)
MSTEPMTRDLAVTRVVDAPVEQVWKAWSDPEHVLRWWGPAGFTSPLAKMDFREGGTSLVCMRSPEGQDLYNTWTYRKIVPMQLIEFLLNFADKDGNRIDPATVGLPPDLPQDVRNVVTLKALSDNETEMTVTEYGYTSAQLFDLSKAGLEQCLDKMAASFAAAKDTPTSENQTDNESQIRELVENWARAVRNEDMDGVLAHHADEIVMFDVPPPLQLKGVDAYKKAWELFFSFQGKGAFDLSELEITASDSVAFCHSIVTCGGKDTEAQFKVRLTIGLRKINENWIVTHEHHSVPVE